MGKIVSFTRSNRNVRTFRQKPNMEKHSAKLSYRNNSPMRWRPLDERVRIAPKDATPAIVYAIGAYKITLGDLAEKGIIPKIHEDWEALRKESYWISPESAQIISVLPEHTQAEIVLAICRNIHDGWVYDNADDFFNYFLDWEFVYLPLELIGVDQLSAIFRPLEKALPRLGLEVSWGMLVRVYDEARERFLKKYKIRSASSLTNAIQAQANTYPALTRELKEAIANREMAFDLARLVAHHSAEIFKKAV